MPAARDVHCDLFQVESCPHAEWQDLGDQGIRFEQRS